MYRQVYMYSVCSMHITNICFGNLFEKCAFENLLSAHRNCAMYNVLSV